MNFSILQCFMSRPSYPSRFLTLGLFCAHWYIWRCSLCNFILKIRHYYCFRCYNYSFTFFEQWLVLFKARYSVPFTNIAELKLGLNWAGRSTKRTACALAEPRLEHEEGAIEVLCKHDLLLDSQASKLLVITNAASLSKICCFFWTGLI